MGGDPVYPTINYIQDPDEVIDFRGADFQEPIPDMLDYLKEHGKIITREELEKIQASKKTEEVEMTYIDEAMARAVDIGVGCGFDLFLETVESLLYLFTSYIDRMKETKVRLKERISRTRKSHAIGGILKSNPELWKSKGKPIKDSMSQDEEIDDSENLKHFLLDFEEE